MPVDRRVCSRCIARSTSALVKGRLMLSSLVVLLGEACDIRFSSFSTTHLALSAMNSSLRSFASGFLNRLWK